MWNKFLRKEEGCLFIRQGVTRTNLRKKGGMPIDEACCNKNKFKKGGGYAYEKGML